MSSRKNETEIKSVLCHPIHNNKDKIVGVIEVTNKKNQNQFSIDDEKIMKVLSLVLSSVYYKFNPMEQESQVRQFSPHFDRKSAWIGKTPNMAFLRNMILKVKDVSTPLLLVGEKGVGKALYANIIHTEGQRGLKEIDVINSNFLNNKSLWDEDSKFLTNKDGTILIKNIDLLSLEDQKKLLTYFLKEEKNEFSARIIATCEDFLTDKVDRGEFYAPLYDYIGSIELKIDPLRRRYDDIELLLDFFLRFEAKKKGELKKEYTDDVLISLKSHDWLGNVKEFKKCVERLILLNQKSHIIETVDFGEDAFNQNKKKLFENIFFC